MKFGSLGACGGPTQYKYREKNTECPQPLPLIPSATVRKEEATRSDLACTLLRPVWAAMSRSRRETVDLDRLLNRVL